jgi:membrane-bound serine protease (ClpP class)
MEGSQLALTLVLIGVGIVLLIAELFLPTGGILFALAVAALVVGVAMPFYYGDMEKGLLILLGVFIIVPAVMGLMLHIWPKTPIGRRMIRPGPEEDATVAAMPVNLELEQLRGRLGRAVSSLRPSGMADFDGKRIDVMAEGMMVDPGTWVRCIDVKAGKVIVRPVDKPDLGELERADFS